MKITYLGHSAVKVEVSWCKQRELCVLLYYLKELEFRYNNRKNLEEVSYKCLGGIK